LVSYITSLSATSKEILAIMSTSDLIASINAVASSHAGLGEKERSELLAASSKLNLALESPREQVFRIVFAVSIHHKSSIYL